MSRALVLTALFVALASFAACSYDWTAYEPGATGATGATASASAASSAASGGGTATSGAGGGTEQDCLDGLDDDGDGLADCADPDCAAGFECVDEAPGGWDGYVRISQAAFPASPGSSCPAGGAPVVRFAGPASADCTPCSCAWQGATCSGSEVTCWIGAVDCTGTVEFVVQPQDASCVADPLSPPGDPGPSGSCAITADPVVVDPGACAPSGGALSSPDPWAQEIHACSSAAGAGCGAGKVCVPRADTEYTSTVCVSQAGNAPCPSGWSTVVDTFSGGDDTRACSACACGANLANVSCSDASAIVYDLDDCDDGAGHIDLPDASCVDASEELDNETTSVLAELGTPSGGTCSASGGAPSGSVQTMGPLRYCCR